MLGMISSKQVLIRSHAIHNDNTNMLIIRCTAGQLLKAVACLDTPVVVHFSKIVLPFNLKKLHIILAYFNGFPDICMSIIRRKPAFGVPTLLILMH